MSYFICPVCKNKLITAGKSLKCENNHCFDISRKGTVNLLLSNRSRHGDDKLMVSSRRKFLDRGYYYPLLDSVNELVLEYAANGCTILDCGCGEGYYTANIYDRLLQSGINAEMIGIDVSKEAVSAAASRSRALKLAAASVYEIPLPDRSCDIVISLFAPFSGAEYIRVLKKGGIYITAFPLEDHLFELKSAVYDEPYKNTVSGMDVDGFELLEQKEISFDIDLENNEDIISLFSMTPYCYKTSEKDRKKLDAIDRLSVSARFRAAAYRVLSRSQ